MLEVSACSDCATLHFGTGAAVSGATEIATESLAACLKEPDAAHLVLNSDGAFTSLVGVSGAK